MELGAVLCFIIVLLFGLLLGNPVALIEFLLAVGVVAAPTELAAPSLVHILAHGPLESFAFVAFQQPNFRLLLLFHQSILWCEVVTIIIQAVNGEFSRICGDTKAWLKTVGDEHISVCTELD